MNLSLTIESYHLCLWLHWLVKVFTSFAEAREIMKIYKIKKQIRVWQNTNLGKGKSKKDSVKGGKTQNPQNLT